MKRLTVLLTCTIAISMFPQLGKSAANYSGKPQNVVITGKIDNYDPAIPVSISVNSIGFRNSYKVIPKTDNEGNFMAILETYIPTDAWITYKTNFQVLLHPNDSLFVHFDGTYNNRPDLLNTIRFGGNRAKTNQEAAKFQQMYYSNEIYFDQDKKNKAIKEYEPQQYLQYLDTIQQKSKDLYHKFVAENHPGEECKEWALTYLKGDHYQRLWIYPIDHRQFNGMNWESTWDIPKGFYNDVLHFLPVDPSKLINSHALLQFSNAFSSYVTDNLRNKEAKEGWGVAPGCMLIASPDIVDSLRIFSTIEFTPDPLLCQIMLTNIFDRSLEKQEIQSFEQYEDIVKTYIKEPFLREPLYQRYLQTKARITNPQVYTKAILKEASNSPAGQLMDSILMSNKGKVIYVDFWATWCGPCLSEMPNSKLIEEDLKNKDVAFVYICLESDQDKWKATLDKFQLSGQHYLLSPQQSSDIRKLFEITGIPFYLLIDKDGTIKEKGSHLRPLNAKDKIEKLTILQK